MPFQPGDHLHVHRRRNGVPYTHHAINFPDGIVVEFGGSTTNKPTMGVGHGTYDRFAGHDRVDVVHHDGHDPTLAMRRAEWLVSCPPPRPYNAIGFNCEHIARWCATGWETESLQIRHGLFGGRVLALGLPITFWLAWLQRTGREMPIWGRLLVGVYLASTVATQFSYHNEIRHFNEHIRANCPPQLRGP